MLRCLELGMSEGGHELPPVLMHYMPWFEKGGYHWRENLDWDELRAERKVASHFTAVIGPYNSCDVAVIRFHLRLMQLAGVKGVIVNWYGRREKYDFRHPNCDAADAIIAEASAMGIMFTVAYEDWTIVDGLSCGEEPSGDILANARAQIRCDFEYIRDMYMSKHGFLKESGGGTSGRPVVLVFGPRCLRDPMEWSSAVDDTFPWEADRPKVVTLYRGGPEVGDGTFSWFPEMKPASNQDYEENKLTGVHRYLIDFYEGKTGTLHIGSVFQGFRDFYVEGRGSKSYGRLPLYDGHTFEATMDQARRNQPTFIQVATWNDWEEGTIIEPAVEWPTTPLFFLLKLQEHILGASNEAVLNEALTQYMQEHPDPW